MDKHAKILDFIATCDDPKKLKSSVGNAQKQNAPDVAEAAQRRLYHVQAGTNPGTLEFDVWQSIHALEDTRSAETGRTTRLSRTRQKIQRVGERQTVADLTLSAKPSSGYQMLLDRGWPELTFEAIALRHNFSSDVIEAARDRLSSDGINPDSIRNR